MYDYPKYLVLDGGGHFGNLPHAVVFGFIEDHRSMAERLGGVERVLGAGFVSFPSGQCFGESVGLQIKSRGEADTVILRKTLGIEPE